MINSKTVDIIRDKLRHHLDYDQSKEIRNKLKSYAEQTYKPLHTDGAYLLFMNTNECSFSINGMQSTNHPYYWCLFSVKSQHVYGDCIEECLDNAIS
jgi:hypothetical protein